MISYEQAQLLIAQADADLICESFNQGPARWLTEWNFPGAAPPRVYRRTEPSDDLSQRSEIERRIFDLGYRPTLKQIEEEYDGEWEVVAPAPDTPSTGVDRTSESVAQTPSFSESVAEGGKATDPTAPLVERLGQEAEPLINALLEPVRAAMAASSDLMDFRERLLSLYPDLDGKAFADLMGQALAVADAQGQWEARP